MSPNDHSEQKLGRSNKGEFKPQKYDFFFLEKECMMTFDGKPFLSDYQNKSNGDILYLLSARETPIAGKTEMRMLFDIHQHVL